MLDADELLELLGLKCENDNIVSDRKEPAKNTNPDPEDKKEFVESELSRRLQEVQSAYTLAAIENDGDDSSDEEEIECPAAGFNFDSFTFPQLAHAIGLQLYWSTEANRIYYKEKTILSQQTWKPRRLGAGASASPR